MRSPSSLMRAAAAATLLCAAAASHAAYLDGTTVSYKYFVEVNPTYTFVQTGPETAVVGNGVEFTPFYGLTNLDFSGTEVSFVMTRSSIGFTDLPFNGLVLGLSTSLRPLMSVSFASDTSSKFLSGNRLSFTDHTISINLGGLAVFAGDKFTLNIAPVPEPQTYAMALAGLGVVGLTSLRRRAAKRALQA